MEMNIHLDKDIFEIVKNGTKHIEVRVNDEKRRKLNIGDKLNFIIRPEEDRKITAKVKDLKLYKDFSELVEHYDMRDMYLENYTKEDFLKLLERFYTKEEQEEWGVIAIDFIKTEKSCGIVVFNDKDEILMIKHNIGHWGVPKGHIEENETEEETAFREVLEETNINASIIDGFRETITYSPRINTTKDVVFFVGKANNLDIIKQDNEIEEAEFMDLDKALEVSTKYPEMQNVLTKAYKFYKGVK